GQEERKTIEGIKDTNALIEVIRQSPDVLNELILIEKLLQFKDESIPLIMEELKQPQKSAFVETAIKVIHRSGDDHSGEILEIIQFHQRDAYA
ncbi:MAG: hypothetical protein GWN62_23355, partial [Aliifodinibius sp.]|nr:hypothetical protein [Fodinibius sp.]